MSGFSEGNTSQTRKPPGPEDRAASLQRIAGPDASPSSVGE
jgi:hypothetical protein